ncbi:MAG: hypothetical protein AUG49_19300 [Catenulispora sp. 13_1_20CM_3_70_7]|nr:MAG: hypothetical protein AUG49_19300 [Catenulispora sp. 13_1_20CM_3_70_7]
MSGPHAEGQAPDRPARHACAVTAARIGRHVEDWGQDLTAEERAAMALVQRVLEDIAVGDRGAILAVGLSPVPE